MWKSYLAMGDSTTEGVGDAVGDLECRSWTDWVADALHSVAPGLQYRNVAVRGATAQDVLREQVPVLSHLRPDFVSLTVGANDARERNWAADTFEADYASILEAIARCGAQVMTATYPDIRPALENAGQPVPEAWRPYFERMHDISDIIRRVGERHHAYLLDLESHDMAKDPKYVSRDFTHPNALGYRLTAHEALTVLADRLGLPELASATSVSR